MARKKPQESKELRRTSPNAEYPDNDARQRFERAVDIAVATKPIRKEAKLKRRR